MRIYKVPYLKQPDQGEEVKYESRSSVALPTGRFTKLLASFDSVQFAALPL